MSRVYVHRKNCKHNQHNFNATNSPPPPITSCTNVGANLYSGTLSAALMQVLPTSINNSYILKLLISVEIIIKQVKVQMELLLKINIQLNSC